MAALGFRTWPQMLPLHRRFSLNYIPTTVYVCVREAHIATCELVSMDSTHFPSDTFQSFIQQCLVPPPVASRFNHQGHHDTAYKRYNSGLSRTSGIINEGRYRDVLELQQGKKQGLTTQ